ncbi:MAG: hypothetical protein ACKO9Q_21010, partial [Pirellula sp.]
RLWASTICLINAISAVPTSKRAPGGLAGAGAGALCGPVPSAETLIEKIGENGPGSFDILICLQKG